MKLQNDNRGNDYINNASKQIEVLGCCSGKYDRGDIQIRLAGMKKLTEMHDDAPTL